MIEIEISGLDAFLKVHELDQWEDGDGGCCWSCAEFARIRRRW